MSSKSTNRATLRAHAARLETIANQSDGGEGDLDIAAVTQAVAGTLSELLDGDAEDVRVTENGETIAIEIDVGPGAVEESEAVANAAPSYEEWLRVNSDRLDPEPSSSEPTNTYGAWLAARGGK